MRNFTISNLFTSVVTRVIDVLAVNGIATRSFHLTSMREHMGYRFEQCPGSLWGELLLGNPQPGFLQIGNKRPELHRLAFAPAYGIAAQTVCPAPRLSQARASWRG
jgi:hypothetical protein